MLPGYNTNGFAHHRLEDAIEILADLGYRSIALTLDHHALDPFDSATPAQLDRVRALLERHALRCVIETGARFLLDPCRKHQPTLLSATSAERQRRLDFLTHAIDLGAELNADAISFWSGKTDSSEPAAILWQRLVDGCRHLCDIAERKRQRIGFEPEPGMFVDTMTQFAELFARVNHPCFGLTLDVGHLHCLGEVPTAPHIHRWRERLWNVHIEDMRHGVHDHLLFGEGDMDLAEVLAALKTADYQGGAHVELSRHAHDAVETARKAIRFLG
jgi:L-ribulose-5-phosphate 3-epimerase